MNKPNGRNTTLVLLALTILGAAAFWFLRPPVVPPLPPLSPVTIAVIPSLHCLPVDVAVAQGLFEQAGVTVNITPTEFGKDALALLKVGKADLAIAALTPFMYAALAGQDIALVSGMSRVRGDMAVVVRADRGIVKLADLKGKTIALTFGTNQPYMLDALLQVNKIPNESVTRLNLNNQEIKLSLQQGRVDGAILYGANLAQIQTDMGAGLIRLPDVDAFASHSILAARASYVDSHPQEVQRALRALDAAIRSMRADPAAASRIVGAQFKLSEANAIKVLDNAEFSLKLDQSLLLSLDDQARWAIGQGLVRAGPVPNFVKFIKPAPLQAVLPAAVQIIH